MAESASILSPDKIVLLPEIEAGCPMADMIEVSGQRRVWDNFPGYDNQPVFLFTHEFTLLDMKARYPGVPVVTYVNTTAAVKAASDICCTSANIVRVIESLPDSHAICVPDRNLSMWAQKNTKKQVITWDGFCHVHDRISAADVDRACREHPQAVFIAHPECRIEVLEQAGHVTSTSGMLRFAAASDAKEFIIGTEVGLLHRLQQENPGKVFYPLRKDMICPNMKKTTLKSVLTALTEMKTIIKVPEEIRIPAKRALDRMLAIL
jgi:quinolinate synthase